MENNIESYKKQMEEIRIRCRHDDFKWVDQNVAKVECQICKTQFSVENFKEVTEDNMNDVVQQLKIMTKFEHELLTSLTCEQLDSMFKTVVKHLGANKRRK